MNSLYMERIWTKTKKCLKFLAMPLLNGGICSFAMYCIITLLDNGHNLWGILLVHAFLLAVIFQIRRLLKKRK